MVCTNGDPNFNKLLIRMFGKNDPEFRNKLFWGVCIWVRLILFGLVLYFITQEWSSKWVPYIVGIFSLFAIYSLSSNFIKGENSQWWSKKFDLLIAVLVLISCIIFAFTHKYRCAIPILLFISLFGGIIQNIIWC